MEIFNSFYLPSRGEGLGCSRMTPGTRFDEKKLLNSRQRAGRVAARKGAAHHGFLHQEAALILGQRLAATKRVFTAPAIFFEGPYSSLVEEALLESRPPVESAFAHIRLSDSQNPILDLEPETLDLAVSVFDLHRMEDLRSMLLQINFALKPDGLFLAVMPATGTLEELKASLMQAELEMTGGAALRTDLFPEIRQYGDLLQKTGFKLPVCDIEERVIRYGALSGLIDDLRAGGAALASPDTNPPISRSLRNRTEEIYHERFGDPDGKIRATFNMTFLSGWKEDQSQQKPLRPGSARHNLKDFL